MPFFWEHVASYCFVIATDFILCILRWVEWVDEFVGMVKSCKSKVLHSDQRTLWQEDLPGGDHAPKKSRDCRPRASSQGKVTQQHFFSQLQSFGNMELEWIEWIIDGSRSVSKPGQVCGKLWLYWRAKLWILGAKLSWHVVTSWLMSRSLSGWCQERRPTSQLRCSWRKILSHLSSNAECNDRLAQNSPQIQRWWSGSVASFTLKQLGRAFYSVEGFPPKLAKRWPREMHWSLEPAARVSSEIHTACKIQTIAKY